MNEHNWFNIEGYIRVENPIAATKLMDFLEDNGMQFFGSIIISDNQDEDYEEIPMAFIVEG